MSVPQCNFISWTKTQTYYSLTVQHVMPEKTVKREWVKKRTGCTSSCSEIFAVYNFATAVKSSSFNFSWYKMFADVACFLFFFLIWSHQGKFSYNSVIALISHISQLLHWKASTHGCGWASSGLRNVTCERHSICRRLTARYWHIFLDQ